jgi:transposase
MENRSHEQAYQQMRRMLNEKQWRQYLAVEAKERGSVSLVAREAAVSVNTVKRGLCELEAGETYQPGERVRKKGGGKKKLVETDATLLADLEQELEPKGDPMSLLRWTSKSLAHLVERLSAKGHQIKKSALAEILHDLGFSLHVNKKSIEGTSHPDREAQFQHINIACKAFEHNGNPMISVDCQKKELIGNFKNNGQQWQAKGEQTSVNVYDFLSLADGKAVPYGIYDLVHKRGFVNVGIDHDTVLSTCWLERSIVLS